MCDNIITLWVHNATLDNKLLERVRMTGERDIFHVDRTWKTEC